MKELRVYFALNAKKKAENNNNKKVKTDLFCFHGYLDAYFAQYEIMTQRTIASAFFQLRMETENEHFTCQDRSLSQIFKLIFSDSEKILKI